MGPLLLDTVIYIDGVPVAVSAERWSDLPGGERLYHFEFCSTVEPARPIPVSETGYRSHFAYGGLVDNFESLLAYAEALARELARQSAKTRAAEGQLSLFGSSS